MAELDTSQVSAKEVLMAALTWDTDSWVPKALQWIDQGVQIDAEVAVALERVASTKHYAQAVRHKAFGIAKRWRRENERT